MQQRSHGISPHLRPCRGDAPPPTCDTPSGCQPQLRWAPHQAPRTAPSSLLASERHSGRLCVFGIRERPCTSCTALAGDSLSRQRMPVHQQKTQIVRCRWCRRYTCRNTILQNGKMLHGKMLLTQTSLCGSRPRPERLPGQQPRWPQPWQRPWQPWPERLPGQQPSWPQPWQRPWQPWISRPARQDAGR